VADRRADFERRQAQKEEDFRLQLARKRDDFNLELARRADDYALQIQQALQDYERQVDERKIQLATELADLAVKRDEALAKLTQVTQPLTVAGAMDPMYYEEALKGGLQGVADAADDVISKENEILTKFFEMAQPLTKQVTIQLIYESLNPELAQPEIAPALPLILQGAGGGTVPQTGPMLPLIPQGAGGGAPMQPGPMLGGRVGGVAGEGGNRLAQPILGPTGTGGFNVSLLQQNQYTGMGAEDQEWYRQAAYEEAQRAIQEAVRSYKR
jgi:hypothetical protein